MLDLSQGSVLLAFGLTLFAGGATAIGATLAFFARRTGFGFLSVSLGFSAGVMLYVSFVEILPKAEATLAAIAGDHAARWQAAAAFFGGVVLMGLIDRAIPKADNPHEPRAAADVDRLKHGPDRHAHLLRTGVFAALAIGIHNFPEGLGTFLAALENPKVGTAIAIAIALHNIPEGVSVAVPIFFATGKRRRAFALSALSGLAEPAGALIGYALLLPMLTPTVVGLLFGAVAGIMVYISLDELLPTAREYGSGHAVLYGLFSGMAVMALSLLLI